MISILVRSSPTQIRFACVAFLVAFVLAACGEDEPNREFAPEINDEQVIETSTALPTPTSVPLNRQPGESGSESVEVDEQIAQTGSAEAVAFGLTEVTILTVESGESASTGMPRTGVAVSEIAPDGSMILTIDRSNGDVKVIAREVSSDEIETWRPGQEGTPEATPVVDGTAIKGGDRIVWNQQSEHAIVSLADVGVFVADRKLSMTQVAPAEVTSVTSVAWAPTGQTIALASWDVERSAANIRTASLQNLTRLTQVLELAEDDGRFVRSMAWGNEQVGLVFALRSSGSGFSLPNDLYHLPRFGQPMRLLATAGAAAPAAVVDQIAIAGDGSTVAFTVLIPGEVGLRYHSLWIAEATATDAVPLDTTGIRRVTDLVWTAKGLAVVGTRRETDNGQAFQSSVVELVTADGLTSLGEVRSEGTPVGSPEASPVVATPES